MESIKLNWAVPMGKFNNWWFNESKYLPLLASRRNMYWAIGFPWKHLAITNDSLFLHQIKIESLWFNLILILIELIWFASLYLFWGYSLCTFGFCIRNRQYTPGMLSILYVCMCVCVCVYSMQSFGSLIPKRLMQIQKKGRIRKKEKKREKTSFSSR